MELNEIIEKFQGYKLSRDKLTPYESWALNFFHDKSHVSNPFLNVTMQLDISEARKNYLENYKPLTGASFTAFLTWNLIKSLKKQDCFSYRRFNDEWYRFDNLPVYIPVLVGNAFRFQEFFLEDVMESNWKAFSSAYTDNIERVRNNLDQFKVISPIIFNLATHIGNLSYLNFTGFTLHGVDATGRNLFYFGKRTELNDKWNQPLNVTIDHTTADPYILNLLIEDFTQELVK